MWGKSAPQTFTLIALTFCIHLAKSQWQSQSNSSLETNSTNMLKKSAIDDKNDLLNGDGRKRRTFKRWTGINKRKNKPVELRKIQETTGEEFFKRFQLRKKNTAEFVSLRCGIGSHWDAATKTCDPHNHVSVEEPDPVLGESDEELLKEPTPGIGAGGNGGGGGGRGGGGGKGGGGGGKGGGGSGSGNRHGKHKLLAKEEPSAEVIIGHIVAVNCGVGFKYDKIVKKCSPLAPLLDQKFPQKVTKSNMKVLKQAEKKAIGETKSKSKSKDKDKSKGRSAKVNNNNNNKHNKELARKI